jgi:hypothetical protein
MINKKIALASLLSCFLAMGTLQTVHRNGTSAKLGWRAAKAVGGSEGVQWAVSGAGGYAGAVAGAWGAVQAGALIGTTVGPVGTFVGGLIGAGVGAW